jgi:hypothetical protein
VETAPDATAVRIVYASPAGSRDIEPSGRPATRPSWRS